MPDPNVPPTPDEIPFELRTRITRAEETARGLLLSARVLAGQTAGINRTLVMLHEDRGGDDDDFDRLCAVTDTLTRLQREIADTVTRYTPR